jgi:hypothetical protein
VLDAVLAYEQGHWSKASDAMEQLRLSADLLPGVYADALRWARELMKSTSGK